MVTTLKDHTAMQMGGAPAFFARVRDKSDLREVVEEASKYPIFPLGEGTNTVFSEGELAYSVLKIELPGFEILKEERGEVTLRVGAGDNWDATVERTVDMGLMGIEALSLIPGTVGATPVQNVGAYGQEVSDVIQEVGVYDTKKERFRTLTAQECQFSYRDSLFKKDEGKHFIITDVVMTLKKGMPRIPEYRGVQEFFRTSKNDNPTLEEIREAIIAIRMSKLPLPSLVPNMGSFFKNPIVSTEQAKELKEEHTDLPSFPLKDGRVKLFAGWLIEKAGFKGESIGPIVVYEKNALVLTNPHGEGSFDDLMKAKEVITSAVQEKFGIALEMEPQVVS